jgi:RNA polymerase sigma-70 factor (ECF subfamily)
MTALTRRIMADWAAILSEHGPHVWRTTYRVLRHHDDASDCYQETFLTAWQLAQERAIRDWGPLLTCVATRKAIDRLRQRSRSAVRMAALDLVPEPIGAPTDPLQSAQFEELIDRLRTGLTALPSKQAEVAWLSCVEEMTPKEIAAQLAITVGEIRVLLHRARARLRQCFAPELTDGAEKP